MKINRLTLYKHRITISLCILIMFEVLYYALCFSSRGEYFSSIFFGDVNDTYADFFKPLHDWSGNPYNELESCNYPALAMMMFKFLHHFLPTMSETSTGLDYRNIQSMNIVFILYNTLTIWIAGICMSYKLKLKKIDSILFALFLILSMPVMFSLERGNQINLAFSLTMFFCFFYNSDNKVVKEIALLALTIASCLKIYPAVFGFLLIINKDWKSVFRIILYGIIFFICPFFYYGKGAFSAFIISLSEFSASRGSIFAYNFSINNILGLFSHISGININKAIYYVVLLVSMLLLLVAAYKSEYEWQKIHCLGLTIIIIPSAADPYVLLFLIPSAILLANEYTNNTSISTLHILTTIHYMVLFIPFAMPTVRLLSQDGYIFSYSYLLYWIVVYTMFIVQIVYTMQNIRGKRN